MIFRKILFVTGIILTWAGAVIIYKTYSTTGFSGIVLEMMGYIMIVVAVLLHEKTKE